MERLPIGYCLEIVQVPQGAARPGRICSGGNRGVYGVGPTPCASALQVIGHVDDHTVLAGHSATIQ
jgi:hypothetical protein